MKWLISRRNFIRLVGLVAAEVSLGSSSGLGAFLYGKRGGNYRFHLLSTYPGAIPRNFRFEHTAGLVRPDSLPPFHNLRLVRPNDLLDLVFAWENVDFTPKSNPSHPSANLGDFIIRKNKGASMTVTFPPQHRLERSPKDFDFKWDSAFQLFATGASSIVFELPQDGPGHAPLANDIATLLEWPDDWTMRVAKTALPPAPPDAPFPDDSPSAIPSAEFLALNATSIEFPWKTYLSPHAGEKWRNSPATPPDGRMELWHSELINFITKDNRIVNEPTVRVVSYDPDDSHEDQNPGKTLPPGFEPLPSSAERNLLWLQTSDFSKGKECGLQPLAVAAEPLMLSSQGGYSKLKVSWTDDQVIQLANVVPGVPVQDWIQDTDWSRDENVLVSRPGFVMPFGHPVTFIHNRKRIFKDYVVQGVSRRFASLIDLFFCEVKEPIMTYEAPQAQTGGKFRTQRGFVFKLVELMTPRTPYLQVVPPPDSDIDALSPHCHWMYLDAKATDPKQVFKFKVRAVDWQDNEFRFELPLYWVPLDRARGDATLMGSIWKAAVDDYNGTLADDSASSPTRTAILGGNRVAYIPKGDEKVAPSSRSRDSAMETERLTFKVVADKIIIIDKKHWESGPNLPDKWKTDFYPNLESAAVRLDACAAFDSGGGAQATNIRYHQSYLEYGFGNAKQDGTLLNPTEMFVATFKSNGADPAKLDFDSGNSGGTVTPNFSIIGVSRKFGPWGGNAQALQADALGGKAPYDDPDAPCTQQFNPKDFLGKDALLLGAEALGLQDIVADIEDTINEAEKVPKLVAQVLSDLGKDIDQFRDFINKTKATLDDIDQSTAEFRNNLAGWLDYWIQSNANAFLDELSANLRQQKKWTVDLLEQKLDQAQKPLLDQFHDCLAEIQYDVSLTSAFADVCLNAVAAEIQTTKEIDKLVETALSKKIAEWNAASNGVKKSITAKVVSLLESGPVVKGVKVIRQVPVVLEESWKALQAGLEKVLKDELKKSGLFTDDEINYYVGLLVKDIDVVADLRSSWKDPGPIIDRLKSKATTLCERLPAPQMTKLQDTIANYSQKLGDELKRLNASIDKLKIYIGSRLNIKYPNDPNLKAGLDDFLNSMDPEVFLNQARQEVRKVTTAIDKFRNFPMARLDSLRNLLDDLSAVLDQPQKMLGEATRIIREVGDVFNDLKALLSGDAQARGPHMAGFEDRVKQLIQPITDECTKRIKDVTTNIVAGAAGIRAAVDNKFDSVVGSYAGDPFIVGLKKEMDAALDALLGPNSEFQATLKSWSSEITGAVTDLLDPTKDPLLGVENAIKHVLEPADELLQSLQDLETQAEEFAAKIPKEIALDMQWNPQLKPNQMFEPAYCGTPANFVLSAHIRKSLRPAEITQRPTISIKGELTNFTLHLIPSFPALKVGFDKVSFESLNGQAPQTSVSIGKVEFDEALQYMAELAATLNPKSGFYIQQIDRGIEAGYRYAIANIPMGGFALFGLSLGAGLQLYFDGKPMSVAFNISQKDAPFLLSAPPYGGGGFLRITLTPNGVETIEGSLEFGADILLDIGVATGQASVNAGIYFSISAHQTKLYGFVHACGHLEIICLINLLVDFHLGLGYESRDGASYAVGEAIVKVEIDMFMFSIEVDLHYRKEMQGSGGSGGPGVGFTRIDDQGPFQVAENWSGDEADADYILV